MTDGCTICGSTTHHRSQCQWNKGVIAMDPGKKGEYQGLAVIVGFIAVVVGVIVGLVRCAT